MDLREVLQESHASLNFSLHYISTTMSDYSSLLITLVLACLIVSGLIAISVILGPKRFSEIKDDPFECGTIGSGGAKGRYGVRYYLVALIFILFDVEAIFLYPYAVNAQDLGWSGFFAMLSILSVICLSLAFVWKRGLLDWGK